MTILSRRRIHLAILLYEQFIHLTQIEVYAPTHCFWAIGSTRMFIQEHFHTSESFWKQYPFILFSNVYVFSIFQRCAYNFCLMNYRFHTIFYHKFFNDLWWRNEHISSRWIYTWMIIKIWHILCNVQLILWGFVNWKPLNGYFYKN